MRVALVINQDGPCGICGAHADDAYAQPLLVTVAAAGHRHASLGSEVCRSCAKWSQVWGGSCMKSKYAHLDMLLQRSLLGRGGNA